jgi:hypothetical protein
MSHLWAFTTKGLWRRRPRVGIQVVNQVVSWAQLGLIAEKVSGGLLFLARSEGFEPPTF